MTNGACWWMAETLPTNVTSLAFYPLTTADAENPDRDGDGLTLAEELFVYGTEPTLADTSGDGISDGEAVRRGLDPKRRHVSDAEILARVAASATNESFAAATIFVTNSLASWKLFDGFAANVDAANGASVANADATNGASAVNAGATNGVSVENAGATNGASAENAGVTNGVAVANESTNGASDVLWERTFVIDRASAWQQFFVSAAADAAAPWTLEGLVLEWEDSEGTNGVARASPPRDSLRLALAPNASTVTLRLRGLQFFI